MMVAIGKFGWSCTLLVLITLLSCVPFCVVSARPHILFIVADDLGWADVGYHGSIIRTPNIDALAAEGVRLENYYVQPICTPSRSVFMTGRYPIRTGLQHGVILPPAAAALPKEERTLAQALKEVGYATHIVGKWHLGFYEEEFIPTNRGFDSHYGYYVGAEDYWNHTRNWSDGVPGLDWHRNGQNVWGEQGQYSTHLLTNEAIRIVANHDPSTPLFLYLPYQAGHDPHEAPSTYVDKYKDITDPARRIYAAMVTCMDEGIGNVTQAFKQYGLWDNTIFVWTSDNGGPVATHSNWPFRGGKHTLFEGGLRVPAFIRSNQIVRSGRKTFELLNGADLYPTLLNLAGANLKQPLPIDGFDVWNTISRGEASPRTEMLHDIDPIIPMAAIRVGDWKLITGTPCVVNASCFWYYPPGQPAPELPVRSAEVGHPPIWLFNVRDDPYETTDLHTERPDVVALLKRRLAWYAAQAVPPQPCQKTDPEANPALHGGAWVPWRK